MDAPPDDGQTHHSSNGEAHSRHRRLRCRTAGSVTDSEATQTMAAALDSRGIAYTPSESEAMALGRPYTPPAVAADPADPAATPAKPAATLTTEQQLAALNAPITGDKTDALMAAAMARPADPSGYTLPALDKDQKATPQMAAAFAGFKAGLHEFGFAAPVGNKIADMVNTAAARAPMTPAQVETARQTTHGALSRQWGSEAPANIKAVQAEVQRVLAKHPHLRPAVELVGNDQHVVTMIHTAIQARGANA